MEKTTAPDPHFITFVAGRDVPCPVCEYNLRDLTLDRCPECGERLVLQLTRAEPMLGLFLAFVLPLLGAAGLGLIFVMLWATNGGPGPDQVLPIAAFIACIPVAAVAVMIRKWFMRAPLTARVGLVVASFALVALLFGLIFLTFH